MSRDMLSYETGEIDRYRGMAWLRLIACSVMFKITRVATR